MWKYLNPKFHASCNNFTEDSHNLLTEEPTIFSSWALLGRRPRRLLKVEPTLGPVPRCRKPTTWQEGPNNSPYGFALDPAAQFLNIQYFHWHVVKGLRFCVWLVVTSLIKTITPESNTYLPNRPSLNHSRVNHVPQLRTTHRLGKSSLLNFLLLSSSSSSSSDLGFGPQRCCSYCTPWSSAKWRWFWCCCSSPLWGSSWFWAWISWSVARVQWWSRLWLGLSSLCSWPASTISMRSRAGAPSPACSTLPTRFSCPWKCSKFLSWVFL